MEYAAKEYTAKYDSKVGKGTNYIPPVKTTYWSFRFMIGFGCRNDFIVIHWFISFGKKAVLNKVSYFLKFLLPAISFPFLANTFGWVMTEVGRQPWTVFGLMTTARFRFTKCFRRNSILFSIILYLLIFTILASVMVYLMVREIKRVLKHNKVLIPANILIHLIR